MVFAARIGAIFWPLATTTLTPGGCAWPAATARRRRCWTPPARCWQLLRAVPKTQTRKAGLQSDAVKLWSEYTEQVKIDVHPAPTDKAEAEYVVHQIEQMVGGTSYFSLDSGRVDERTAAATRDFGDFAVLYRLNAQVALLVEALERSGIPYQVVGQASPYAARPVRSCWRACGCCTTRGACPSRLAAVRRAVGANCTVPGPGGRDRRRTRVRPCRRLCRRQQPPYLPCGTAAAPGGAGAGVGGFCRRRGCRPSTRDRGAVARLPAGGRAAGRDAR